MKRKTTKEILAESFRELAESKSIDKITVQEIVNNCDYSTATFYRHFKDKYDLIAWDHYRAFTKHLLVISKQKELDEKTSLLARTYCLGTVYLSCEWITGKYDVTPDELAEIYGNALPQPLLELMKEK